LRLVARSLTTVLAARRGGRTQVLLEHTAGQGTVLGHTFEQLATIIELTDGSQRLGVWLDTCHLLAAGYDIVSPGGYRDVFRWFERTVGLDRLKGFHLNDSKMPFGSRVDRHAHIGEGHIGLEAFGRLLNDPRFRRLPMLLETPKTEGRERTRVLVDPLDERNLATLRDLLRSARREPRAVRRET
jgi:deoxyribonuclease-4